MDASTLERAVSESSKSLSWLNGWLVAMTAIVVAGLLIEYIPELPDEWRKFRDIGGWKALRNNKATWKPLAILVGAILVTAGVAGEMVFEELSFYKEGQLETAHGQLDSFLQGKAQDAATSAQNAKNDAKAAHDLAQSAFDIAEPAKETASKAKGVADTAKLEAGAASAEAGNAQASATTLSGQLTAAKQELADAQTTLRDIATCLAPRVIPIDSSFNATADTVERSTVDAVRPFSNLQAIIDVAPDAEARRAASNIERGLRAAGWTRITVDLGIDGLTDGVEIDPWNPRELGDKGLPAPDSMARLEHNLALYTAVNKGAEAIKGWLHSFNWYIAMERDPNPNIPSDAIAIKVGLYPAVQYIAPPGDKWFADFELALRKRQEEAWEQAKAEDDRRFEEQMKQRPPEMAAEAREARRKAQEDAEKWEEEFLSEPCRYADPFIPRLQ